MLQFCIRYSKYIPVEIPASWPLHAVIIRIIRIIIVELLKAVATHCVSALDPLCYVSIQLIELAFYSTVSVKFLENLSKMFLILFPN